MAFHPHVAVTAPHRSKRMSEPSSREAAEMGGRDIAKRYAAPIIHTPAPGWGSSYELLTKGYRDR